MNSLLYLHGDPRVYFPSHCFIRLKIKVPHSKTQKIHDGLIEHSLNRYKEASWYVKTYTLQAGSSFPISIEIPSWLNQRHFRKEVDLIRLVYFSGSGSVSGYGIGNSVYKDFGSGDDNRNEQQQQHLWFTSIVDYTKGEEENEEIEKKQQKTTWTNMLTNLFYYVYQSFFYSVSPTATTTHTFALKTPSLIEEEEEKNSIIQMKSVCENYNLYLYIIQDEDSWPFIFLENQANTMNITLYTYQKEKEDDKEDKEKKEKIYSIEKSFIGLPFSTCINLPLPLGDQKESKLEQIIVQVSTLIKKNNRDLELHSGEKLIHYQQTLGLFSDTPIILKLKTKTCSPNKPITPQLLFYLLE